MIWRWRDLKRVRIRVGPRAPLPETRQQMIAYHSRFLSRIMGLQRRGHSLPRIPRRRVDQGGFTELLRHPGARAAAAHFWKRLLGDRSR